jgi:REP element-mobilizing transposase RayT
MWIHFNWTTKYHLPVFTKKVRFQISQHIRENAHSKGLFSAHINIVDDHVHILLSMKANQSISSIVHLIKGESSHWINQQKLFNFKFEWQEEYYAKSVGESELPYIRRYIRNQGRHHLKKGGVDKKLKFIKWNDPEILVATRLISWH